MTPEDKPPVAAVVAMIPVVDVEKSAAFYGHLGFRIGNRQPKDGPMHWAWLYQPNAPDWRSGANLMLTRAHLPVDRKQPQPLFYLYVENIESLRVQLLEAGKKPGKITYPEYLPNGELELIDPDGHCLMLAQRAEDTP